MENAKQLGAQAMFDQSLIYLFNSFREQGMSKREAEQLVVSHIRDTEKKYSGSLLSTVQNAKASKEVDDLIQATIQEAEELKQSMSGKLFYKAGTLIRNLTSLQNLLHK